MIAGIFHQGSGVGNQLHRYVATRVLALDKGYEFGMQNPLTFKAVPFMKLDLGEAPIFIDEPKVFQEKRVEKNGVDVRGYDPEVNFVEDNTIIDGEFQDPRYFMHRIDEVREWLKVETLEMPDDLCVINFRGGEFALYPDLFLTPDYWQDAMKEMISVNPGMRFEIHTDDLEGAKSFFKSDPNIKVIADVGLNWRSIRYAKYLILANSSFAILPALCNQDVKLIIAPRYWARRNTKVWALPQNYYKQFMYI